MRSKKLPQAMEDEEKSIRIDTPHRESHSSESSIESTNFNVELPVNSTLRSLYPFV